MFGSAAWRTDYGETRIYIAHEGYRIVYPYLNIPLVVMRPRRYTKVWLQRGSSQTRVLVLSLVVHRECRRHR